MADSKTIGFKNISAGPRGVNGVNGLVLIDAGKSADVEVTEAEFKSAMGTGYFGEGDGNTEPGPLDGSVADLEEHAAAVGDVDEIQKLIDAETAGKSRKGAIAVLEARRDALLA